MISPGYVLISVSASPLQALHGIHPHVTHLLVNLPLLFGACCGFGVGALARCPGPLALWLYYALWKFDAAVESVLELIQPPVAAAEARGLPCFMDRSRVPHLSAVDMAARQRLRSGTLAIASSAASLAGVVLSLSIIASSVGVYSLIPHQEVLPCPPLSLPAAAAWLTISAATLSAVCGRACGSAVRVLLLGARAIGTPVCLLQASALLWISATPANSTCTCCATLCGVYVCVCCVDQVFWIVFNAVMVLLMGVAHQGGVVASVLATRSCSDVPCVRCGRCYG